MMTSEGQAMIAQRLTTPSRTKPPSARLEMKGNYLVVTDGKPKKDKARFPDVALIEGDSLVLDLGGPKVWIYTEEQFTKADQFQYRVRLTKLLLGRSPWVSKKRLREVMKDA